MFHIAKIGKKPLVTKLDASFCGVFKNILHIGTAQVMPQTTKGAPCGCALKAIEKHGRATSRLLADVSKDAAVDVENVSVDEV